MEVALKNRTAESIAIDFLEAKKMEEQGKALRLSMAKELVAELGARDEGSQTHRLNGFKIEIKGVINRKMDRELMKTICAEISAQDPDFVAPIKMVAELDEAGLKWYRDNKPSVYERLAKAITATPGSTGVTVSRTE